jgi:hypothetical protein
MRYVKRTDVRVQMYAPRPFHQHRTRPGAVLIAINNSVVLMTYSAVHALLCH